MTTPSRIHCAIYTRKSSEEGLEQSFNSLDAQREACEAYIVSQRHEGWQLIPTQYDDGGFSGGNMERPALKRLLDDIAAKRVDTVPASGTSTMHLIQTQVSKGLARSNPRRCGSGSHREGDTAAVIHDS
ncbi:MAG: recombinase family protein [Acidobacteriaceae bacterium]